MKRNPLSSLSSSLSLFHLVALVFICIIYLVLIYHLYSSKEIWYRAYNVNITEGGGGRKRQLKRKKEAMLLRRNLELKVELKLK